MSILSSVASESAQVMIYKHPRAVIFMITVCAVFVGGACIWANKVFAEKAVEEQVKVLEGGLKAINLQIVRASLRTELRTMRLNVERLKRLEKNGTASPDQINELHALVSVLPEVEEEYRLVNKAYRKAMPDYEEWDIRDGAAERRRRIDD